MQEGLKGVDESDKEPAPHLSALRGLVKVAKRALPMVYIGEGDTDIAVDLDNAISAAEAALKEVNHGSD